MRNQPRAPLRREEAVKTLQATNPQLAIDGVFDPETRAYLLDLINDPR